LVHAIVAGMVATAESGSLAKCVDGAPAEHPTKPDVAAPKLAAPPVGFMGIRSLRSLSPMVPFTRRATKDTTTAELRGSSTASEDGRTVPKPPPRTSRQATPRRHAAALREQNEPQSSTVVAPSTPRPRSAGRKLRQRADSDGDGAVQLTPRRRSNSRTSEKAGDGAASPAVKLPAVHTPCTPREPSADMPAGPRSRGRAPSVLRRQFGLEPSTGSTSSRGREASASRVPAAPPRQAPAVAPVAGFAEQHGSAAERKEMLEVQGYAQMLLNAACETKLETEAIVALSERQPELAWLARCMQRCPLPPCWTRLDDEGASATQTYLNTADDRTTDEPPLLPQFVELAKHMMSWRRRPRDAAKVSLALQDYRQESFEEARCIRAQWTGPHLDQATGEEFWHCPASGVSTWGDPGAAADFVARVAERLQQAMPTSPLVSACLPKEASKDANEEMQPGQEEIANKGEHDKSYLVGTWVYSNGAREYDVSLGADDGLQFHETNRDAESGVVTRSVSGHLQNEEGWMHAALADSAGKPQGEVRLRAAGANQDGTGMFAISHPCALAPSVRLALKEDVITELEIGAVVEVVEVVRHEEQHRIRARLENPAGWISIEDTLNGHRWAERQRCMICSFRMSDKECWGADTLAHKKVDIATLVAAAEAPDAFAARLAASAMAGQTPPRPQTARHESSPIQVVPPAPAAKGRVASPPHKSPSPMKSALEGPSMKSIEEEEQLSVFVTEEESPPQNMTCSNEEAAAAVPATDAAETAVCSKAAEEEEQPEPELPAAKPAPPPPCAPPPPWVVAMANKRSMGGGTKDAVSAVATPRATAAAGAALAQVAETSPEPTKAMRASPRPPAASPGSSPSIFLVIEDAPLEDLGFGTPRHSARKNLSSSIVPSGNLDGWEEPMQKGGDKGGGLWPSKTAGRRRMRAAAGGS